MSSAQNALFQRLAELGFVECQNQSVTREMSVLPNLDATFADMIKGGADILLAYEEQALKSARRAAAGRVR